MCLSSAARLTVAAMDYQRLVVLISQVYKNFKNFFLLFLVFFVRRPVIIKAYLAYGHHFFIINQMQKCIGFLWRYFISFKQFSEIIGVETDRSPYIFMFLCQLNGFLRHFQIRPDANHAYVRVFGTGEHFFSILVVLGKLGVAVGIKDL